MPVDVSQFTTKSNLVSGSTYDRLITNTQRSGFSSPGASQKPNTLSLPSKTNWRPSPSANTCLTAPSVKWRSPDTAPVGAFKRAASPSGRRQRGHSASPNSTASGISSIATAQLHCSHSRRNHFSESNVSRKSWRSSPRVSAERNRTRQLFCFLKPRINTLLKNTIDEMPAAMIRNEIM